MPRELSGVLEGENYYIIKLELAKFRGGGAASTPP